MQHYVDHLHEGLPYIVHIHGLDQTGSSIEYGEDGHARVQLRDPVQQTVFRAEHIRRPHHNLRVGEEQHGRRDSNAAFDR